MNSTTETQQFQCHRCGLVKGSKLDLIQHFRFCEETLHEFTDENTEAVHSRFRLFKEKHGYKCNIKGTPGHTMKQQKSVVHYNSLNIGDK